MRSLLILPCAVVALALSACTSGSKAPPAKSAPNGAPTAAPAKAQAAPRDPTTVAVLESKTVTRRTTLLGFVDVDGSKDNKKDAMEALRAKAAQLGADAVIGFEYHPDTAVEKAHYSGVAIKYRKRRARGSETSAK